MGSLSGQTVFRPPMSTTLLEGARTHGEGGMEGVGPPGVVVVEILIWQSRRELHPLVVCVEKWVIQRDRVLWLKIDCKTVCDSIMIINGSQ